MLFFYQLLISFLLIFSPIVIFYRILKNKEDKKRYIEKFSISLKKRNKGKLIWFHGASVGEILSIIPLIEYYDKSKLVDQILITSSTLSSSKIVEKFKFNKTIHQFYPIDHLFFTSKFLNYWKPSLAIFIESEIWPCMFRTIKDKNIPLVLLNARLTKKTFRRWLKIGRYSKSVFNNISNAYPQNFETKSFLKKLNLKNNNFIGNLKFSENPNKIDDRLNFKLIREFKKKKIWVASSTHKSEEVLCAKAHIELKKKYKNLLTIIIPRHIHRVNEIISEIEEFQLKVIKHSKKLSNLNNVDIYIVDTFGETKKFHEIASSVFLGGSIIDRGGQNPLEAARFGAKILHGPNTDNFIDIYKLLNSFKISKKIYSSKQLASSITFSKNKYIGKRIKKIGVKILKKTIKELNKFLKDEFKKT